MVGVEMAPFKFSNDNWCPHYANGRKLQYKNSSGDFVDIITVDGMKGGAHWKSFDCDVVTDSIRLHGNGWVYLSGLRLYGIE